MRPQTTNPSRTLTRRQILGALVAVSASLGFANGARAQATKVDVMAPDVAYEAAKSGEIILIDIRRPEEWLHTGVAEGAIGLDMTQKSFVDDLVALRQANPDTPLALICRTGNRTSYVSETLAGQGFPGLVNVKEGMVGGRYGDGWLKRGLPIYEGTLENVRAHTQAVLPKP